MKNAIRVSIAVTITSISLGAQNLVPNPGFENLKQKPCNYMQFDIEQYIFDWKQGGLGSSDIVCDDISTSCNASMSDKSPGFGTETPHGGHTAGMIRTFYGTDYREYLGATFTEPLQKGRRYYVEFYVSACDRNTAFTNNIGMVFYTGAYTVSSQSLILAEPLVNCETAVTQTEGWQKISGYFTADKDYTWFVIGNFFKNDETIAQNKTGVKTPYGNACYYLDDVTVRAASNLSVTGDTLVKIGTKATLIAKGGSTYQWADSRAPNIILGSSDVLTVAVPRKTKYYVYSNGDTAEITVNVRKEKLVYIDELEGRKVRKGRTVIVHHDEITVSVHDKNEIDGDSITLYYGDSLIVEHLALTKKKQSFTLKIDKENPTQLILYAENLGSVPPNTAALTIKDGRESTDIVLGSDFKYCDSVMLQYKDDD